MSFLSAPRRDTQPAVPERMQRRGDLTEAQKKRLALWSKMGMGLENEVAEPNSEPTRQFSEGNRQPKTGKQAMLERERQLREQREKEEEEELEKERQAAEKKKQQAKEKMRFGFAPLGPVQPREVQEPPPTPAAPPPPASRLQPGAAAPQMKLSISASTVDRVVASAAAAGAEPGSEYALPGERDAKKAKKVNKQVEQNPPKKGKKKKKKKKQDYSDEEDEEETEDEEEEEPVSQPLKLPPNKYAQMHIESVKGKVSRANENMTDKDLERRFGSQTSPAVGSGLMSEEQALALLTKEKQKRRPESAAARVKREAEEWEETKHWRDKRKRSRSGGRMITSARGQKRY